MKTWFRILVINQIQVIMKMKIQVIMKMKKYGDSVGRYSCAGALLSLIILFSSCDHKADLNDPIGRSDAKPLPVTVKNIENINGAALVEYALPNDDNINYIEAVYEINGKEVKTKASFYTSTLLLEGFPEAGDYTVSVYSVSFSEIRSEPVTITVSPTTPPYKQVAENLQVNPIFGGVKAVFTNPTKAYLQIAFFGKNELGNWEEYQTLYTSRESGEFFVRDLEPVEQTFAVVCRDRWQNVSDTITITTTPMFEELADLSLIQSYPLPTDLSYEYPLVGQKTYHTGAGGAGDLPVMWDGNTHAPFPSSGAFFFFQNVNTSIPYAGLPSSITIDLGRKYMLSRIVFWPRSSRSTVNYEQLYNYTHPKEFELWGSNDPSPDGSYETWTLIKSYKSVRPSGNETPGNANSTEEDRLTALNGENFDIPEGTPPFRYIRYKVLSTWGNQNYWSCSELQFYGQAIAE